MDQKQKQEQLQFFIDAFEEVVVPVLDNILGRVKKVEDKTVTVEENMATKDDIDRIERKIVKIDDKLDRYGDKLDNHEKKIKHLGKRTPITP